MPDEIRIGDALGRASITIEPEEKPDERSARLQRQRAEGRFDLFKRYVLFVVFVVALSVVGAVSAYEAVFDPAASSDTRRWAHTSSR